MKRIYLKKQHSISERRDFQHSDNMVGEGGFEPPNPKEQIYSLLRLTTSLLAHDGAPATGRNLQECVIGRGRWNRTTAAGVKVPCLDRLAIPL